MLTRLDPIGLLPLHGGRWLPRLIRKGCGSVCTLSLIRQAPRTHGEPVCMRRARFDVAVQSGLDGSVVTMLVIGVLALAKPLKVWEADVSI